MTPKSNISATSTAANDTHNTSAGSKKSLFRVGSSIFHRIQSSTSFMGPKHYNINVQLLDDLESVQGTFKKTATGQDVLDFVCKELNIVEKEYFGLRYNDKYRYWLNLSAPLSKTFTSNNVALSFRFRFYPRDLDVVKEEVTRYNLFVQLQRDLNHGRLQTHQTESAQLAALILQADQGDFDEECHLPGYVSEFKLLLRQSPRTEEKIAEFHKELRGMSADAAIDRFLRQCIALTTYGVNPYTVTIGKNQTDIIIGASSSRVLVFVMNQPVYNMPWEFVSSVDYSGKHLKIGLKDDFFSTYLVENPDLRPEVALSKVVGSTLFAEDLKPEKSHKKIQLKFTCPSSVFAKHLWRDLLSQQVFFNEDTAATVKPRFSKPLVPLVMRGSSFYCPTTRVYHELEKDTTPPREIEQHEFARYHIPRQKSRSNLDTSSIKPPVSVPSIKIETSSVHMNDSEVNSEVILPPTESPIELPIIEQEPTQGVESHETYNQIHVDSPATKVETKPVELQNGNTFKGPIPTIIEPTSTVEVKNGTVANGKLTNGTALKEQPKVAPTKKPTIGRQIFLGILDLLVIFLLLSIVVIAVFEVVGPHEPEWFHPHVSNFRANVYNPWRTYAIKRYNRLFY